MKIDLLMMTDEIDAELEVCLDIMPTLGKDDLFALTVKLADLQKNIDLLKAYRATQDVMENEKSFNNN